MRPSTKERPLCRKAIEKFGLRFAVIDGRRVPVGRDGRRAFPGVGLLTQMRKQETEEQVVRR